MARLSESPSMGQNQFAPLRMLGSNMSSYSFLKPSATKKKPPVIHKNLQKKIQSDQVTTQLLRRSQSDSNLARFVEPILIPTFENKPQMVDAAVQCDLNETATQTEAVVAPIIQQEDAVKYTLDLGFETVKIDPENAHRSKHIEAEPYQAASLSNRVFSKIEDISNHNFLTRFVTRVCSSTKDAISNSIDSSTHAFRRFFYQTDYELLLSLLDPSQEIRVSRNWFSSRAKLYSLSSNIIHAIFINWPKMFYNEIIPQSSKSYTLLFHKLAPQVIENQVRKNAEKFDAKVESVLRRVKTVLDDNTYSDERYMIGLEKEIKSLVRTYALTTSSYKSSKKGFQSSFEKIKDALEKRWKKDFPNDTDLTPKQTQIRDALFMIVDDSFSYSARLASEVRGAQEQVLNVKNEKAKDRLFGLAQILLGLQKANKSTLEDYKHLIQDFDSILAT